MSEIEAQNLQRMLSKQPAYLKALGILAPLVTVAILGYILYLIGRLFKE
jgi:hypothetical protein